MAKITNPGLRPIELPTRHIVPRNGTLETSNDVLRCPDNAAALRGLILSGAVTVEYDPDPAEPEATASIVAAPEAADPPTTTEAPAEGTKAKKG